MSKKTPSRLEIAKERVAKSLETVNKAIENLGNRTGGLYEALCDINNLFCEIRGAGFTFSVLFF